MDELACFINDSWDLEAILNDVDSPLIINDDPNNTTSISQQDDHHHDHELLCSTFPEFSETTNLLIDEYLSQELYKYKPSLINPAVCHSHNTTLSSQTIVTTSISTSTIPKELQPSEEVALQLVQIGSKKKKKKKVVVKKVRRMDGSFSDEWTWRKYGQKPIKGSSYPRSYYRCSSSKGCLARKQVEKIHLDPEVFLVTYTNAEHNHIQPSTHHGRSTRKNNSSSTTSPFVSSSTVTVTETETHDYSPKPN